MATVQSLIGAEAHRFFPHPAGGEMPEGRRARVEIVLASSGLVQAAMDDLLGPERQATKLNDDTGELEPRVDGQGLPVMEREITPQEARVIGHFACPDVEAVMGVLEANGIPVNDYFQASEPVDAVV